MTSRTRISPLAIPRTSGAGSGSPPPPPAGSVVETLALGHEPLVEISFLGGTRFFSFGGTGTPTRYYEARLQSVGAITREISPLDADHRVGDVTITVRNVDRELNKLKSRESFYGRQMKILFGNVANGFASLKDVFTGKITRWIDQGETWSFTARDDSWDKFNLRIDSTAAYLSTTVFPFLPADQDPLLVPIVYGDCQLPPAQIAAGAGPGIIPCYLVDPAVGQAAYRYVVAQHVCRSVVRVFRYGVLVSASNYSVLQVAYAGRTCTVLDFTSDQRDANRARELEITADVIGITYKDSASGRVLENPVEQVEHFLKTYAATTNLDQTTFLQAKADCHYSGYTGALALLDREAKFIDIVNTWCRSFLLSIYSIGNGNLGAYVRTAAPRRSLYDLVRADAPWGYWRLGETTGSVAADSSGNGRTGTYANVMQGMASLVPNDPDPCGKWNGEPYQTTGSRVIIGQTFSTNQNFSICLRVKNDFDPFTRAIWANKSAGDLGFGVFMSAGKVLVNDVFFSGSFSVLGNRLVEDDLPHDVVVTFDGAYLRIYVDGVLDAEEAKTKTNYAGGVTSIGWSEASNQPGQDVYSGFIDEVRIYEYTMTEGQVWAHYKAGLSESTPVFRDEIEISEPFQVQANSKVASRLRYLYNFHWARQFYGATEDLITGELTNLGKEIVEGLELLAVRSEKVANAVARAYADLYREQTHYVDLEVRPDQFAFVDLNKTVQLTHWQGIGRRGEYRNQNARIVGLELNTQPESMGVRFRAIVEAAAAVSTFNYHRDGRFLALVRSGNHVIAEKLASRKARSRDVALALNPVAYWRLGDAGSSVLYDDGPNGIDGYYVGGVTLSRAGGIEDDTDSSVLFDGSSAHAEVPHLDALNIGGPFSVAALAMVTSAGQTGVIFEKSIGGVAATGYWLVVEGGQLRFKLKVGGVTKEINTAWTLPVGAWAHVIGEYDGTNLNAYANGYLRGTPVAAGGTPDTGKGTSRLGAFVDGTFRLTGRLDEVLVCNYALGAANAKALYHATVATLTGSPVLAHLGDLRRSLFYSHARTR